MSSSDELLQPFNVQIIATPTQPGQTLVDQSEYNMLVGLGKNAQKGYLQSRAADPSGTILTVKETVRYDGSFPNSSPEIFADGFESGDTSAWSSSSPTDPVIATVP